MSDPLLRLSQPEPIDRDSTARQAMGSRLVAEGIIDRSTLVKSLALQNFLDAPLGEILVANGDAEPEDVARALSLQYATDQVDLIIDPPAALMSRHLPARLCLRYCCVPWRWFGATLLVATDRPDTLADLRRALGPDAPRILPVLAPRNQIIAQIGTLFGTELASRALTRVPEALSSRNWTFGGQMGGIAAALLGLLLAAAVVLAPLSLMAAVIGFSVLTLVMTAGLKAAALMAQFLRGIPAETQPHLPDVPPVATPGLARLPRISMLVPLFREENIAQSLIRRISRLTYPKALLEVVLVLEAKDHMTRATLAQTKLPHWIRVVEVPDDGTITTKPRALNYALDFTQGQIVGIWDAEDAPEADQLEKVAAHFARAPPETACLQGMLDYYNARQNWLARCFTIEYAAWWRVILPGVARLGLALPLGGTTLFFRRTILEELGGWDAHNVTEDADLGLRLARAGYRTALIPTVTMEEANCTPWAWIKQRSRWIKGYLLTYCVHMRRPGALLRDLGLRQFLGVQAMFLGTVLQFVTLPLLWSFWLPAFGLPHPLLATEAAWLFWTATILFISAELLNTLVHGLAVTGRNHRHLLPWIVTMPFYFPLASIASYKALIELVRAPFFWDKTRHGHSSDADD